MYNVGYAIAALTACLSLLVCPLVAGNSVYVADCCLSGSSISVINQISGTQLPGIPVTGTAVTVAISPDGSTVFAATTVPYAIVAIATNTTGMTATLPVGGSPVALAISPDGSTLYLARCALPGDDGCDSSAVDVISTAGLQLITSIPVPQGAPEGISLNASGTQAYVTTGSIRNSGTAGIAIILTGRNIVLGFLPSLQALLGNITVLPSGTTAFVADPRFPVVYRIDLSNCQVLATILLKSVPTGMVLSADGLTLYVAGQDITGINTLTNAVSFRSYITATTGGLTTSPDGKKCYIADYFGSTLDTFDLTELVVTARVPTGFRPVAAVVTPDGSTSFVAASGSSTVSQIDGKTNTLVAQAEAGSEPIDVKLSPAGNTLYATNAYSSNVSFLSTAPLERLLNIPTGYLPTATVLSPDGTRLYVNTYGAAITVIDTAAQSVIGTIPTAPDGSTSAYGMAMDKSGKTLYVLTSYLDFSGVLVIDTGTDTVVQQIPVAGDLAEIAVEPLGEFAYISGDTDQPFLIVVDLLSGKQVKSIPAYKPFGVKVSPSGKFLYTGTTDNPSVNVFNRATGKFLTGTPVSGTVAIALNSTGTRLYATGLAVSVIDTSSMVVIATIDTGGLSFGVIAP